MRNIPKQHEMPELLSFLADRIAEKLRDRINIDRETAHHVGCDVAMDVAKEMPKQLIYIPSGEYYLKHKRDEEIWNDFSGNNHNDLARKYNISLQWVYMIIKKMREIKMKEVQMSLFETEEINDE